MTARESLALAMLRGGCSYDDAMEAAGLTLDEVKAIFEAARDRIAHREREPTN